MKTIALTLGLLLAWTSQIIAAERKIEVADDASLRRALADARPGSRIVIAPGKYQPGVSARGLRGTKDEPIILEAADPKNKPLFQGGALAFHFGDCAHLTIRNLVIRGQSGNGINIDDGGSLDTASHHITLDGLDVFEIGPRGNRDPIKLSGLDDFIVRNCTVEGWAGQAIDMVGCHRGLVEGCTFRGKEGFDQGSGPQTKGGSSQITIRNCTFINSGQRGVNIGGSTALRVFRPQGAKYEAKEITVEGCRFTGSLSPICFVGVDGATVRYNTIYRPEKWVLRILQETTEPGFVPCRSGVFEKNLIVFQRSRIQTAVNIGGNTDPRSFIFRENFWFCEDAPASSRPQLPSAEQGGVHGADPKLKLDQAGAPSLPSADAAKSYGAHALPAAK